MPSQLVHRLAWGLLVIGGLSTGLCLFDLIAPGHFVGDMYGVEVMFRLLMLAMAVGALCMGGILLRLGKRKQSEVMCWVALIVLVLPTLVLMGMAGLVLVDRRNDAVRRLYPSADTAELLRVAREEKDRAAIDTLLVRRDPAAVRGLCEILLDAHEDLGLRCGAAHALGELGGPEARAALEQARGGCADESLRIAIDYALERRIAETQPAE